jgi:hypothetical protein
MLIIGMLHVVLRRQVVSFLQIILSMFGIFGDHLFLLPHSMHIQKRALVSLFLTLFFMYFLLNIFLIDMSWPRYGTSGAFLSCGKDGKLIINFTNAPHRPFIYANNVALDANTSSVDEFIVAGTFLQSSYMILNY